MGGVHLPRGAGRRHPPGHSHRGLAPARPGSHLGTRLGRASRLACRPERPRVVRCERQGASDSARTCVTSGTGPADGSSLGPRCPAGTRCRTDALLTRT